MTWSTPENVGVVIGSQQYARVFMLIFNLSNVGLSSIYPRFRYTSIMGWQAVSNITTMTTSNSNSNITNFTMGIILSYIH